MTETNNNPALAVERVRHTLKFRLLHVLRTESLAPHMVAITFTGDDLDGFISASFDDHVKLFFPEPGGTEPILPGPDPKAEGAAQTIARDYTPYRYDATTRELEIRFVLHDEAGPASSWAATAKPGDKLGIGGPRGSFVIPTGFDWFLMLGDSTAIPAIGRRLREVPAGSRVIVVLEADADERKIAFDSQARVEFIWVDAGGRETLKTKVEALELPPGEGYVWAAGEGLMMRAVHAHFVGERGFPKGRIRASSYWKHGAVALHETLSE